MIYLTRAKGRLHLVGHTPDPSQYVAGPYTSTDDAADRQATEEMRDEMKFWAKLFLVAFACLAVFMAGDLT